jgi:splicing factor 3B subunit 4
VGNLEPQVNEELLWEIFVQAGPVVNVYMPKDRVTNSHQGYAFVEFRGKEDAEYAIKILNMVQLYGVSLKVNKSSQDKKSADVGANLFVGNLDPEVEEKSLYDTFSAFGLVIRTPIVMRDPETSLSRGFGFVSFDNFESSDAAIEAMNGQFLCNRPVSVNYAFKKDSRGERHGTPAERMLAQSGVGLKNKKRPHTRFADAPGQIHHQGQGQRPPRRPNNMPPMPRMPMQMHPPPMHPNMGGPPGFPRNMPMPPPPNHFIQGGFPGGPPGFPPPPPMMMGNMPPGMLPPNMPMPPPPPMGNHNQPPPPPPPM